MITLSAIAVDNISGVPAVVDVDVLAVVDVEGPCVPQS
jgi:hypothetical protein